MSSTHDPELTALRRLENELYGLEELGAACTDPAFRAAVLAVLGAHRARLGGALAQPVEEPAADVATMARMMTAAIGGGR